MINRNLDLKPINDLLGDKFFVPSYQRGYRWTKREIKALLDDINQFFLDNQSSSKEVFYCLQPLVVSKQKNEWILIDGQQRLTTIYLILKYLEDGMKFINKVKYTLSYATRPGSEEFLDTLDPTKKLDNIDYFHILEAYEAIEEWFANKDGGLKIKLLNTFLDDNTIGKNVKVIWYEINNKDAIEIFTRINMGKIPLTNAELIKALFLKEDNLNINLKDQIQLRKIEIASEWDNIENTLQNNSFWYFIHDNHTKYDTRIEFIFDLMKNKSTNADDYYTFVEFSKDFEDETKKHKIWLSVKEYFMTLQEWYNSRTYYHLIGFLINSGNKINELLENSRKLSKIDFHKFLKTKIKEKFNGIELEDIYYGDKNVRNILLLYNIETILQNSKSNIRFPFDEYKKESWDIEHISSVSSEMPSSTKSTKWLENILEYFKGDTVLDHYEKGNLIVDNLVNDVIKLLKKDKYNELEFKKVYEVIIAFFKEDYTNDGDIKKSFTNSLSNLTLLDMFTNRSYQNAVFPVKRKRILSNDMKGIFVPICTKNVFLKYYSEKLDDVMFWQKSDAQAYLKNIELTLKDYL